MHCQHAVLFLLSCGSVRAFVEEEEEEEELKERKGCTRVLAQLLALYVSLITLPPLLSDMVTVYTYPNTHGVAPGRQGRFPRAGPWQLEKKEHNTSVKM